MDSEEALPSAVPQPTEPKTQPSVSPPPQSAPPRSTIPPTPETSASPPQNPNPNPSQNPNQTPQPSLTPPTQQQQSSTPSPQQQPSSTPLPQQQPSSNPPQQQPPLTPPSQQPPPVTPLQQQPPVTPPPPQQQPSITPPQQQQPSSTPPQQQPSSTLPQQPSSTTLQQQKSSIPLQQQQQQQQQQPQQQSAAQQPQQQSAAQHGQTARPHPSRIRPSAPVISPSTNPVSTSIPASSPVSRGGVAIGVPARPSQPSSFSSFGSSYTHQFGGMSRNFGPPIDSTTNQVRPPVPGIQTIGMVGSLSASSQMRQTGMVQPRNVQSSIRSQATPNNHSQASPKLPSQGILRAQSMVSPSSPSPTTPQGSQPPSQSWGASSTQGKHMHPQSLPSTSFRQPIKPPTVQQRSHPQSQPLPASFHPQIPSSVQQHQLHQSQEHFGQQYPSQRAHHSLPHQQQVVRGSGLGNQKALSLAAGQPSVIQSNAGESGNRILGKRCIQELVSQVDPLEKLDPEVEDILIEIAEDFVDSITTFGCSLAKHRKSATLEAKDILLHLERNWNITLPGFGGDEIKSHKKQCINDIHKERLAAVKKSMVLSDAVNTRSFPGQAAGNAKGHVAKLPAATGSPKGS